LFTHVYLTEGGVGVVVVVV